MTVSFYVLRELFTMAQRHPQKVAIVLDDQIWTYGELVEQVQRVACQLHYLNITKGQIIYQFVERSIEMICGFVGTLCAGGVYCPINPTDPPERVASILEQLQGQYVLLHGLTYKRFPLTTTATQHSIRIEEILLPLSNVEDTKNLPNCREYGAAIIICTSGTTGRPKAVVHTFQSVSAHIVANTRFLDLYTVQQQGLQVAACSWILHVSEILSALVVGGTLVLLRPNGHLDMAYFSETVLHQQATSITIGPGLIRTLTHYLETTQRFETFQFVRKLCVVGKCKYFIYSQNYVSSLFYFDLI